MRAIAALILLAAAAAAQPAPPTEWLVIAPVDRRGRRPFNPDHIFKRYLLRRGAEPPREGETVLGTRGKPQAWRRARGEVTGRVAYAYATVECARARIVLARLAGGGRLYVNGDAFVGDIYGSGHAGVPVALRKGRNHLFVRGLRGRLRLEFKGVEREFVVPRRDATLPDRVQGREMKALAGVLQLHASLEEGGGSPPLGLRKLAFEVSGKTLEVEGTRFELRERKRGQPYRRTFRSAIDGSVQEYSVLPPAATAGETGLVLTLHGAGVDAFNQVRAYSRKRDLWIVAPTNRRPFGFDWQDWGRRDAYEVLEDALRFTGASRDRIYLTGHSMGGHGTWHLAANDPDRFAAIAPSAGWATFDSYVGRPHGRRDELWRGADGASLTMQLMPNLAQIPVFILHGEKDDNVPLREALAMETFLMDAGGLVQAHYQKGAGHWWDGKAAKGADCVDWPGIFDLFARHQRERKPARLDFISMDPGIDADHYWLHVEQPLEYGKAMRVRARREGGELRITTTNVRRFSATPPGKWTGLVVDGQRLPAELPVWLLRASGVWKAADPVAGEKSPQRSGPFKRVFDNRFLFVYGDNVSMRRARFDAQMWWYRGNGDVEVVSDEDFLRKGFLGRNVVVYGNATTNRAWDAVFGRACPVRMEDRALSLGERNWFGKGLGCLFVYPRRGEPEALAAAFAHGDEQAARVGYTLLPFVSGVGYPDYVVFSDDVLTRGDEAVMAAGWFGPDWSLPR